MAQKMTVGKRIGMEVSIAVSYAVQLSRAEAIAAYPITPQTHIVEHLSSLVANGELEAEFITVESEHSAMMSPWSFQMLKGPLSARLATVMTMGRRMADAMKRISCIKARPWELVAV